VLLTAAALVTVFTVAAGSRSAAAPASVSPTPLESPCVCKSEGDAGHPPPHGLLLVADRAPEVPCIQGG
jgi:hypothetical protein